MIISHIVAIDKNFGIGKDNDLLCRLPLDLKNFKNLTTGHHILLGRKNFDSIGRALPNRTSLILTTKKDLKIPECYTFNELEAAVKFAKDNHETELFIIGGGQIYEQTLNMVTKIYLTRIEASLDADIFYPKIKATEWSEQVILKHQADEKHPYSFEIVELTRIKHD